MIRAQAPIVSRNSLCAALTALQDQTEATKPSPWDLPTVLRTQKTMMELPSEVNAILGLALRTGRPVSAMTEEFVIKQILSGGAYK